MPFANIKVSQTALSSMREAKVIHRVTDLFVGYMSETVRQHGTVLIEDVPDGGCDRADEVSVIPDAYSATSRADRSRGRAS